MRKGNDASRDRSGQVAFIVPLWKRSGLSLELFDNYWRDVHGPVCARLPGQYQYWQHHLGPSEGGVGLAAEGVGSTCAPGEEFHGLAELTFRTLEDRQVWFQAAAILMNDEHNLFSKAIGYNTAPGNSRTYVDGLEEGALNGRGGAERFHAMVRKAPGVSVEQLRRYLTEVFAPAVAESEQVLKLRLHLFEEVDNSRPDAPGVIHREPPEQQYQAAFEFAVSNRLELEQFLASETYARAMKDQARFIQQLNVFPERTTYTFVYEGRMTLAGQRGSTVAELITNIGALNQLQEDVVSLMLGGGQTGIGG